MNSIIKTDNNFNIILMNHKYIYQYNTIMKNQLIINNIINKQ